MHWTEPATADDSHAALKRGTGVSPVSFQTNSQDGCSPFYTPTSIVKLIVEILEPYHGRILDPACGSGGMFIQSARFVEAHQKNPTAEISVHRQDQWAGGAHLRRAQRARRVRQRRKLPNPRVTDTARLARLNLAVHGLRRDIKQGNAFRRDLHPGLRTDYVINGAKAYG